MKIVVTGGAGFIGSAVCRALAAREQVAQIVVIDNLSTGSVRNIKYVERVQLVDGSILDHSTILASVEGASAVVHLAARASVHRDPARVRKASRCAVAAHCAAASPILASSVRERRME